MKGWKLGLPFGFLGFALIIWQTNWIVAIGAYLMLWAYHMCRSE